MFCIPVDPLPHVSHYIVGLIPYDGTIEKEIVSIHPAVTAIYVMLACVGVVFAVACLIFNFLSRNQK